MSALPTTFFGWVGFILDKYGTLFLSGVGVTLLVAITGTVIGFVIGLLVAILRTIPVAPRDPWFKRVPLKVLSALLNVYIEVFRGTPMIVQAMVIYYGIPYMGGPQLGQLQAAILIVSINTGAYMAEIVRGGLNGVSKGQFEAGYAQGFNTAEVLLYIVLPQAYRNIVPTLLSQVITTIKDSSYLANVATIELMARIRQLLSAAGTYNGLGTVNVSDVMVLFGTACVIYFIINFTLSCIVRSMQNKRKKALVFAPAKNAA